MTRAEVFDSTSFRKSLSIWSCLALLTIFIVPAAGRADTGRSNGEVTAGIQSRLYRSGIFKHGEVNVQVAEGVATLTGAVDSYGQQQRAIRAAGRQHGVNSVVNNIQVRGDDVSPQQILEKARHEVLTYPYYTVFDNITLSTQGNDLTVAGQVTRPSKKSELGKILADIKGVTNLRNNIQVLPLSSFDDHIRVAVARRIYGDPAFFNYGNQANPPIHIIVNNGNVVLEGVVNSNVDRQKAATDARFAATYFALENNLRVESQNPA
ncbi:MAG TPA: BON domain-containing protein [Terriglobia bacterium]|nr:BON domain-containing protein [Terriglobia bacterium]